MIRPRPLANGHPPNDIPAIILITGANGAGKSYLARCIAADRPVTHYDALRLTKNWARRPKEEYMRLLAQAAIDPRWVIEGGSSMLRTTLPRADLVIWLQPPIWQRAWQLLKRSLRYHGRTRPELPPDNTDQFWPQIQFGWRSLRKQAAFDREVSDAMADHPAINLQVCRSRADISRLRSALSSSE